uniref:Uncharacterized protein n=1 Tax=Helianthus annuus TaxID=4232 RepID=A0A251SYD8_HELAN
MHHMSEMYNVKEFVQQNGVVYVPFHNKNPTFFQQDLTSPLRGRIVIIAKIV